MTDTSRTPDPFTLQQLAADQTRTLDCPAQATLTVVSGRLWVTQSGDTDDYFLGAGQSLAIGHGRLVIEADGGCAAHFRMAPAALPRTRKGLIAVRT